MESTVREIEIRYKPPNKTNSDTRCQIDHSFRNLWFRDSKYAAIYSITSRVQIASIYEMLH